MPKGRPKTKWRVELTYIERFDLLSILEKEIYSSKAYATSMYGIEHPNISRLRRERLESLQKLMDKI